VARKTSKTVHDEHGLAPDEATITIRFVVAGEDAEVIVAPETSLRSAMCAALLATHNTGRPTADWEVRRETGVRIDDLEAHVDATHAIGWLFLSLQVGAGGDTAASGTAIHFQH
jgi:hypothetical protein